MENSYGIGVTNRFELFLDDESDPLEALKLKEQEKELKKKNKVAEKENKGKTEQPPKTKSVPAPKKLIKEVPAQKPPQENKREDGKLNQQRSNTDGKPYNKFPNENREERNNRRNREDTESNRDRDDRPRRGDPNSEHRGGRSSNTRAGGPRGAPRSRKREFDRQSGSDKTGVKPVDKRDGAGPHNWGSHRDVIEEVDKSNEMDASWGEPEKTEAPVNTPEKETEIEIEPVPVEEEPKELTLDEWKAQRAGRAKPQYNIRKAGEGEDPSQWKKMYELNKKKAGEEDESEEEEYDVSEYPQRVGRQKHVLDIDIHFNDARRGLGGRGRGARAGPRGNRTNREQRPGARFRGNEEPVEERTDNRGAPKVDDERDFPSLG